MGEAYALSLPAHCASFDRTPSRQIIIFPAREVHRYLGTAALSAALTLPQLERATGWKYDDSDSSSPALIPS